MNTQKPIESMNHEELTSLLNEDILLPLNEQLSPEDIIKIVKMLDEKDKLLSNDNALQAPPSPPLKKKLLQHKVIRRVVLLAGAFSLAFCTIVTAYALGYNVVNAFAKWTNEVFHFEPVCDAKPSCLDSFQISDVNFPPQFIPAWLPNGFEKVDETIKELADSTIVYVSYCRPSNSKSLHLTMVQYNKNCAERSFEIEEDAEKYQHGQYAFYIFCNKGSYTATWSDGLSVFEISGDLEKSDLTKIIDSLGG